MRSAALWSVVPGALARGAAVAGRAALGVSHESGARAASRLDAREMVVA